MRGGGGGDKGGAAPGPADRADGRPGSARLPLEPALAPVVYSSPPSPSARTSLPRSRAARSRAATWAAPVALNALQ